MGFKNPDPIRGFPDPDQKRLFVELGMKHDQHRGVAGVLYSRMEADIQQAEALGQGSIFVLEGGQQVQHQGGNASAGRFFQQGGHLITGEGPRDLDPLQGGVEEQLPAPELPVEAQDVKTIAPIQHTDRTGLGQLGNELQGSLPLKGGRGNQQLQGRGMRQGDQIHKPTLSGWLMDDYRRLAEIRDEKRATPKGEGRSGGPPRKIPVGKDLAELQFAAQAKFAFGVAQMGFHGGRGNDQLVSDFFVGVAQAGQGGDLFFSGSERLPGFQVPGGFLAVLQGKNQHPLPHFV